MTNDPRPTKNERRTAAREAARAQQQQRVRRQRLAKGLTVGGIVLGAVAIVAVVTVVIVTAIRPAGPGPANMASGGVVVGEGFAAETTPALQPDDALVPTEDRDDVAQIVIYQDYLCPVCGAFEAANGPLIERLVGEGVATVEYRSISFLDRLSLGERYSTRSANAAACVADAAPDRFFEWNRIMYDSQPNENTVGLSDDELVQIAERAEVPVDADFRECIESVRFGGWVQQTTTDAQQGEGTIGDVPVNATPTVFVDGEQYRGQPSDAVAFNTFVTSALGQVPGEGEGDVEATPEPSED